MLFSVVYLYIIFFSSSSPSPSISALFSVVVYIAQPFQHPFLVHAFSFSSSVIFFLLISFDFCRCSSFAIKTAFKIHSVCRLLLLFCVHNCKNASHRNNIACMKLWFVAWLRIIMHCDSESHLKQDSINTLTDLHRSRLHTNTAERNEIEKLYNRAAVRMQK